LIIDPMHSIVIAAYHAMPVLAGMITVMIFSAVRAKIDLSAQGFAAAAHNSVILRVDEQHHGKFASHSDKKRPKKETTNNNSNNNDESEQTMLT